MATMQLSENELELLIESLAMKCEDKKAALATSQENNLPFTARDFGIPQIEALLARIEAVYNEEPGDESHHHHTQDGDIG